MPDAGDSALLVSGTAGSEGGLARSLDRTLLTFAGYHAGRGTVSGSLANQTGLAVPRGLATVSAQGVYTLMQTSSTVYSGNNIRGAAADGTNNFWTAGTPNGTYWFHPPETPVNVQVSGGNTIAVRALGGSLYFSTQKRSQRHLHVPGRRAARGWHADQPALCDRLREPAGRV